MGRVDEAIRRAAEGSTSLAEYQDASVNAEAFPTERRREAREMPAAPRERVAPVEPVVEPLSSGRFADALVGKTVTDPEIDGRTREQYRRLAASLHAAQLASGIKVILVSSALAGEGKTLTAANLAMTFSETYQRRVLVIDADLRRPSQHSVFSVAGEPGLSDSLLGESDAEAAMPVIRLSPYLSLVVAGRPTSDPQAVLSSARMEHLVQEARQAFDWVIIDTPPVGIISDASLLLDLTDGAIMVVKACGAPFETLQRAVSLVGKERVLGVVLNQAAMTPHDEYAYDGYYYNSSRPAAR